MSMPDTILWECERLGKWSDGVVECCSELPNTPSFQYSNTPARCIWRSKKSHRKQAHDILTNDTSVVYIDVRTEREFANGHPQGAVNIPVAFPDPARGMMVNSDFVKVVEANFPREKKIIVGCQAGPRSTAASVCCNRRAFKMFPTCSAASAACAIRWAL